MQRRMKVPVMVLGLAAVLLLAGGVALAAIPSSDGTINACYKTQNGQLRVIDSEAGQDCLGSEMPISWNQEGTAGPQGPQGPQGTGISGWEMVDLTTAVSGDYALAQSILCPSGKKVLSGGYRVLGAGRTGVIVMASQPTGAGNGWYFEAHGDAYPASTAWNVRLFAICANVQ